MSDVRHGCVYYYYNSCHGNAAKRFSILCDNDYRTIYKNVCVCVRAHHTVVMVILLRDSQPLDLHFWKFISSFRG
jgi:hypothetical protein